MRKSGTFIFFSTGIYDYFCALNVCIHMLKSLLPEVMALIGGEGGN